MDLDLFAGPGGWDTGLAMLGVPSPLGIEHGRDAVATARAAGHLRLDHDRADVAELDPHEVAAGRPVRLLIASPPCQAWSKAGKRGGIRDQPRIWAHLAAVRGAGRWIPYGRGGWHDDRSPLVLELVRWVDALRPEMVAAEQVPDVLPFWEEVCCWLRALGYSATCGLLSSEQWAVPQTRLRAFLVARRDGRPARLPAPTHARYVAPRRTVAWDDGLFDTLDRQRIVLPSDRHLLPWVSMADAFGWTGNAADRPARTMCGDRSPRWMYEQGENSYSTGWTLHTSSGYDGRETTRENSQPAPTLTGESRSGWYMDRPATTVQGDPRLAAPGHRDREGGQRQFDGDAVRITVEQAGVLQGFPADYPWSGNRTSRFRQVGDAVPPPVAAAVLGELIVGAARATSDTDGAAHAPLRWRRGPALLSGETGPRDVSARGGVYRPLRAIRMRGGPVPWVRIDEEFTQHPKVVQVGPLGVALQVAALCYANRHLTDGFIPHGAVRMLLDFNRVGENIGDAVEFWSEIGAVNVADRLVQAGIWQWDEAAGGYRIHDYHDYQPSRGEVEAERRRNSEAGKRSATARAAKRGRPQRTVQQPVERPAATPLNGSSTHPSTLLQPVPVPVPLSTEEAKASSSSALERADIERVCAHLADRIAANGSRRPTVTQRWRDSARLLIDRDGRSENNVHTAIDWCQDDEFWRSNILSLPKLREKYDQLRLAASRPARATNGDRRRTATEKANGWLTIGLDDPHPPTTLRAITGGTA